MSRAGVAALLAGAAVSAAGCSNDGIGRDEARQGGSVVVAHAAPPGSLDPALASAEFDARLARLAYVPPLTYSSADGSASSRLVPALSEDLPRVSGGGRVYELTFREGLRYRRGAPLRARDFERSIVRALRLDPAARERFGAIVGAERASETADLPGIEADDAARTVRIELDRPDRLFPYALATVAASPVPARTPLSDLSSDPPPGIGPYRVARVRPDGDAVLVRRRGWSSPAAPAGRVEEVVTRAIPAVADRVRAALDDRVDVVEGKAPVRLLPDLRSTHDDRYAEHQTQTSLYVTMDPRRPPFDDERVRHAVSYALDEGRLARIHDGFILPSCNVVPPTVYGYRKLDPCPYGEREGNADLVRASQLVEEADAAGSVIRVERRPGPRGRALSRYLAGTLEKIGLSVRLVPTGSRVAQAGFGESAAAAPHPYDYLGELGAPVVRVRTRLLAQERESGESERRWADVDRDVVGEAYAAPYGIETTGVLTSKRVDTASCSRYHPFLGLDYGSICLR